MKGEKDKEGMEINGLSKVLGFLTDSKMPSLTLQSIFLALTAWIGQSNGKVLFWNNSCWEIAILLTHHSRTLRACILTPFYRCKNQGEFDRLKENPVRGIESLFSYHLMHQWAPLHPNHSRGASTSRGLPHLLAWACNSKDGRQMAEKVQPGQALCPPHSSPGPGASSCLCLAGPGFHRGGLKDMVPHSKTAL